MSRRLLLALLAPLLAAVSAAAVSTPAHAHHPWGYEPCAITNSHTWLRNCRACWERIHRGRAFRVERQRGNDLLVWNLEMRGWVSFGALTFAPQRYCRAAGI